MVVSPLGYSVAQNKLNVNGFSQGKSLPNVAVTSNGFIKKGAMTSADHVKKWRKHQKAKIGGRRLTFWLDQETDEMFQAIRKPQ
jgi:hypothetical protein